MVATPWYAGRMDDEPTYDDIHDQSPATHGDLAIWGGQIGAEVRASEERLRQEMRASEQRTRRYFDRRFDELFEHIETVVENRLVDLGAARNDQVLVLKDTQADHEERIVRLESDRRYGEPAG